MLTLEATSLWQENATRIGGGAALTRQSQCKVTAVSHVAQATTQHGAHKGRAIRYSTRCFYATH